MTHDSSSRMERWFGPALCLALVLIAAARDGGAIAAPVAGGLSVALLLGGVVWALSGGRRIARLAELYLWLAFILAVDLLRLWTDAVAGRVGVDAVVLFQAVGVGHGVGGLVALAILGAWTPVSDPARVGEAAMRRAAGLLIAGAIVFWVGARTFPGMTLEAVSSQLGGHLWTAGCFAVATLITLPGLGFLTLALRDAGDRVASTFGFGAFAFGAVFWVLHLAMRLTVYPIAAEAFADSGAPPAWFAPWRDWGGLLFGFFSVLAYVSVVAYGVAVLRTHVLPRSVGWACIVVGVVAAPMFGPPLFIHVVFWVVGILLLRRVRSIPDRRPEFRGDLHLGRQQP